MFFERSKRVRGRILAMVNWIELLETVRKEKGLKPADMARLMGTNSLQQYNNWVYRNRLPDDWIDQAIKILRAEGQDLVLSAEILHKIEKLPPSKAKIILSVIDEMLASPQVGWFASIDFFSVADSVATTSRLSRASTTGTCTPPQFIRLPTIYLEYRAFC